MRRGGLTFSLSHFEIILRGPRGRKRMVAPLTGLSSPNWPVSSCQCVSYRLQAWKAFSEETLHRATPPPTDSETQMGSTSLIPRGKVCPTVNQMRSEVKGHRLNVTKRRKQSLIHSQTTQLLSADTNRLAGRRLRSEPGRWDLCSLFLSSAHFSAQAELLL